MRTKFFFILFVLALLSGAVYVIYGLLNIHGTIEATVTGKHANVFENRVCSTQTSYSKCTTVKEESYIIFTDLSTLGLPDPQEVSVNSMVLEKVEIGKRYRFLGAGWPCCFLISEILDEGQ